MSARITSFVVFLRKSELIGFIEGLAAAERLTLVLVYGCIRVEARTLSKSLGSAAQVAGTLLTLFLALLNSLLRILSPPIVRPLPLLVVLLEVLDELFHWEEIYLVSQDYIDCVHQLRLDAHTILPVADVCQFSQGINKRLLEAKIK